MPQLIKPGNVKIMTNNGEIQVSISLELNVNLNTDGMQLVSAGAQVTNISEPKKEEKIKEPSMNWAIPDFDNAPQINFGK
jgi:hypothetical protein